MSFTESLTVHILGDSSGLQQELERVLEQLGGLSEQFAASATSQSDFAAGLLQLSEGVATLQLLGETLSQVGTQLDELSQQTISLNDDPALQSLQLLTQTALSAAWAIQSISSLPIGLPAGTGFGGPGMGGLFPGGGFGGFGVGGEPIRQFAGGGLVAGPTGIDQIAARLTAGEYVLNRTSVQFLGVPFLEQLNAAPQRFSAATAATGAPLAAALATPLATTIGDLPPVAAFSRQELAAPLSLAWGGRKQARALDGGPATGNSGAGLQSFRSGGTQTTNHFGGITIQVRNQLETEDLLRQLQQQGIGNRIRRG